MHGRKENPICAALLPPACIHCLFSFSFRLANFNIYFRRIRIVYILQHYFGFINYSLRMSWKQIHAFPHMIWCEMDIVFECIRIRWWLLLLLRTVTNVNFACDWAAEEKRCNISLLWHVSGFTHNFYRNIRKKKGKKCSPAKTRYAVTKLSMCVIMIIHQRSVVAVSTISSAEKVKSSKQTERKKICVSSIYFKYVFFATFLNS